jgi:hypothetical protein
LSLLAAFLRFVPLRLVRLPSLLCPNLDLLGLVHFGKVALPGGRLWVLSWWWLYILPVHLLRWSLHLSIGSLHLELRPLHLKLRAMHLHWHLRPVHLRWLEELVRLREEGPTILSEHCPWNGIFLLPSFSISLIMFSIGLVDHVLEGCVVCVGQLELNVIIQSIQEHVLLLFIGVDVFGGVSRQLNELVEVLIHFHVALSQVSEFFLLQLHGATRHIVRTKTSLELVPLVGCRSKGLVRNKKNFLVIHALGDHELLLNSLKPIFGFHWFLSL